MRKGTEAHPIPCIAHPLSVAAVVLKCGGTEEQVAAALLHDVVEDCGGAPMLVILESRFSGSPEVVAIGETCTDEILENGQARSSWLDRKRRIVELRSAVWDAPRIHPFAHPSTPAPGSGCS